MPSVSHKCSGSCWLFSKLANFIISHIFNVAKLFSHQDTIARSRSHILRKRLENALPPTYVCACCMLPGFAWRVGWFYRVLAATLQHGAWFCTQLLALSDPTNTCHMRLRPRVASHRQNIITEAVARIAIHLRKKRIAIATYDLHAIAVFEDQPEWRS